MHYHSQDCQRAHRGAHRNRCTAVVARRAELFSAMRIAENADLPADDLAAFTSLVDGLSFRLMLDALSQQAFITSAFMRKAMAQWESETSVVLAAVASGAPLPHIASSGEGRQLRTFSSEVARLLQVACLCNASTRLMLSTGALSQCLLALGTPLLGLLRYPVLAVIWNAVRICNADLAQAGVMPLLVPLLREDSEFGLALLVVTIVKDLLVPSDVEFVALPALWRMREERPQYCAAAHAFISAGGLAALLTELREGCDAIDFTVTRERRQAISIILLAVIASGDADAIDALEAAVRDTPSWEERDMLLSCCEDARGYAEHRRQCAVDAQQRAR